MQFFYIDYMNGSKKERNVGFLRVERKGICVGLRGVPALCNGKCDVYAIDDKGQKHRLGEVRIENGYGMERLSWSEGVGFEQCIRVEIPFYAGKKGVCVLRDCKTQAAQIEAVPQEDLPEKFIADKWEQLLDTYPEVHIYPEAQSILIKPRDLLVLTQRYHSLISNSFVLHSYYNYRQLLLFRFGNVPKGEIKAASAEPEYYLGVPGVYFEREKRISQMFGFEGFDIGEARMRDESKREIYEGCFGYYMKRVEI